jgi:hypothetical protein
MKDFLLWNSYFTGWDLRPSVPVVRGIIVIATGIFLYLQCLLRSYVVSEILGGKKDENGKQKKMLRGYCRSYIFQQKYIISKIRLLSFAVGRKNEELSKTFEEKLGMNFQWFSIAVDEITDVNDRYQLAASFRGIDMEFNVTKELAALIPVEETAKRVDLYENVKMMMQCLNIPIRILAGAVTDEASSICGRSSSVSLREE